MGKLQKPFQGSVDKHLRLLHTGSIALQQLVNNTHIQNNKAPTMFHSDLHKRNVFVSEDPMVATGFINWQLTRIEPAFYYADDVPDFATPLVSNEEMQTSKSAKVKEFESLCSQDYAAGLALLAPRMNAARNVNETLLRPFRYCHRTWRDSLVPVTHELLELQKHWNTLGFKVPCSLPQDFTVLDSSEAHFYREREEMFNDAMEIKGDLLVMVGTDDEGWIPPELLEEKKSINQSLWNAILCHAEDQKDRNDLENIWSFDLDQGLIRTRRQKEQKENDKSGIRTHAPYETRKLIIKLCDKVTLPWRLGPLGHLASTVEFRRRFMFYQAIAQLRILKASDD